MKTYQSYQKLEEPYFNFFEILAFPVLPLGVVALISYALLYLTGLKGVLLVDLIIVFIANLYYHGLKNASPNGSSYAGENGIRAIFTLLPSFLVIFGVVLIVNTGFYILYLYQKTDVFYAVFFYAWLFVLVGLPFIYFAFNQLQYKYQVYVQARRFTPLLFGILKDVDLVTFAETFDFLQTQKALHARVFLEDNKQANDSIKDNKGVSTRNLQLYVPVHKESIQIPKETNRLKLSWYSVLEDVFYSDEIEFPYQNLDFVENKYPTNLSKTLRGYKTDKVMLRMELGGKVTVFTKHKTLIKETVLKSIILDPAKKQEFFAKAKNRNHIPKIDNLLSKTKALSAIKKRAVIREFVCNWQVTGTGLNRHKIEIEDVFFNFTSPIPLVLDVFEERRLPILFKINYRNYTWMNLHVDAEQLFDLLKSLEKDKLQITFVLAVDFEKGEVDLQLKNKELVLPFTAWEKVLDSYRWKDALSYFQTQKEDDDRNDFLKRIYELIVEKEYAKSDALCEEALKKYPFFPMVYFYKARLLWYIQGFEASYAQEDYFLKKVKNDPFALAQIYNHFGCLYDEEKSYPESLARFEKAYASYPEQLFYLANMAEIQYKLKNANKALELAQECLNKGCTLEILTEIIKNKGVIC